MDNFPFFRSYKLSPWNIVTMSLYSILSVGMLYYYAYAEFPDKNHIVSYTIGTHLFLYVFYIKPLRNFKEYLYWLTVAIIHFCFFLYLKDLPGFKMGNGNSVGNLLRNTLILLLLFQALRYLSLKIQGQELDCPSRSPKDKTTFDGRKPTLIDYLCLVIYLSIWGLLFAI